MSGAERLDTRQAAARILALLEPELAGQGYDLLDVRIFQGGGRIQVRVYVDLAEGGINLDQCADAARTVGMLLEEADLFAGQYVIEVSSPGIRRPLRTATHFTAAVGEDVELKTADGRVKGRITAFADGVLTLQPKGEDAEPRTLRLGELREANLDPEFDAQALINADRRRRKDDRRAERAARSDGKGGRSRPRRKKNDGGAADDDASGAES